MNKSKQPGFFDACARITTSLFPLEEFTLRVAEVGNVDTVGNRRFAASLAGADNEEIVVREFDASALSGINRNEHIRTMANMMLRYWKTGIGMQPRRPDAKIKTVVWGMSDY